MKKIIAILLSVLMLTTLSPTISAAVINPGEIITPNWAYMNSIEVNIDFSGGTGTAQVDVERIALVTKSLNVTLTVYQKIGSSWIEIGSISDSSTRSIRVELDFDAESGVTYKAIADVTAYGTSGGSESDTVSRTEICP